MLARCNTTDRQYCYFIVQGNGAQYRFPDKVLCYYYSNTSDGEAKIKFPPAVLNKPYIGTCDAAGDPRPIVNASLNTEHHPHSIFITNTTVYILHRQH